MESRTPQAIALAILMQMKSPTGESMAVYLLMSTFGLIPATCEIHRRSIPVSKDTDGLIGQVTFIASWAQISGTSSRNRAGNNLICSRLLRRCNKLGSIALSNRIHQFDLRFSALAYCIKQRYYNKSMACPCSIIHK